MSDYHKPARGVPFIAGNPGRPRGARNKLKEEFIQALHDSFLERGRAAIDRVIDESPEAYLRVIASIMPRDLNVKVSELDHLTDEELEKRIAYVTAQIVELKAREAAAAALQPDETPAEPAQLLPPAKKEDT